MKKTIFLICFLFSICVIGNAQENLVAKYPVVFEYMSSHYPKHLVLFDDLWHPGMSRSLVHEIQEGFIQEYKRLLRVENSPSVNVFPIPSNNQVTIETEGALGEEFFLQSLINPSINKTIKIDPKKNIKSFELIDLPSGTYVLKGTCDNKSFQKRIIKQ